MLLVGLVIILVIVGSAWLGGTMTHVFSDVASISSRGM
jgi:hypothetical protein